MTPKTTIGYILPDESPPTGTDQETIGDCAPKEHPTKRFPLLAYLLIVIAISFYCIIVTTRLWQDISVPLNWMAIRLEPALPFIETTLYLLLGFSIFWIVGSGKFRSQSIQRLLLAALVLFMWFFLLLQIEKNIGVMSFRSLALFSHTPLLPCVMQIVALLLLARYVFEIPYTLKTLSTTPFLVGLIALTILPLFLDRLSLTFIVLNSLVLKNPWNWSFLFQEFDLFHVVFRFLAIFATTVFIAHFLLKSNPDD